MVYKEQPSGVDEWEINNPVHRIERGSLWDPTTYRVQAQYERFPYPPKGFEDENQRFWIAGSLIGLDRINDICFDGRIKRDEGIRVLCAGDGTGSETIPFAEQLRDTPSEVIYVDLSQNSMRVARKRAKLRGLSNISWYTGSLLDLPDSGLGKFDIISCLGVLHHLEDPQEGLHALTEVLKPNGALDLSVYGSYGRRRIYQLREEINQFVSPDMSLKEKIGIARNYFDMHPEILDANPALAEGFATDNELVDCLFHAQDQHPFSVPMLHDLLDGENLKLVSFTDLRYGGNFAYRPETYLDTSAPLGEFSERERQAYAERLSGCISQHAFLAMKERGHRCSSTDPDMIPYYPMSIPPDLASRITRRIAWEPDRVLPIAKVRDTQKYGIVPGTFAVAVFRYLDGERTIGEMLTAGASDLQKDKQDIMPSFSSFLDQLRDAGWIVLRHRSTPPFRRSVDIQQRQLERNKLDGTVIVEDFLSTIIEGLLQ